MAILILPPGSQAKKSLTTRIKIVQFGDGYAQRSLDGINHIYDDWDVTIPGKTNTEADLLETQLAEYAATAFYWHPENLTPTKKYRIEGKIGRIYHTGRLILGNTYADLFQSDYPGYSDLSFKLVQVFEA